MYARNRRYVRSLARQSPITVGATHSNARPPNAAATPISISHPNRRSAFAPQ
ncbi:hypothetical protein EJ06DRAFT_532557 [Trichodelitschia bisporula]|uniref:Uncharacterized protein n=1 Tax=Trichodelitschia bisporula TaxID=703511 RepID=A0A6G1HQR7_9PEZI|nr:hypothetical protein EJ06DRAFT_532557 [Trichodelitschia bisporula]